MKAILFLFLGLITIIALGCEVKKQYSQEIIDLCKKVGKLECHGDCVDGFGSTDYYDSSNISIKQKFNKSSYISFSREQTDLIFASHSKSVCSNQFTKCYNDFQLKKNGELKLVSCEEFFKVIEEKNKSCNGCLDIISAGCC